MPENSSRVSIVRCPKCAHLLPELPRYSVYRCGGCGGLLRADKESSVTDNLSENSWETRSGGSSRREGNEGRVIGVDLARKSPMRSRYPDATRKSPMRERNLGDFDGGIDPSRGNGRRTPARRASKSPMRSRNVDASRKSPMRERNFGAFDAQSKSSGRSSDADARKSPLRRANPEEIQARDKVGAWVEHVKGEVGYVNKLVTPTESFSGWLPGVETADQNQIELNRPSASPRKRRTWRTEDPKERPEPISEIEDQIDDEHGNVYGRRHAEVPYDDWVEEDDYGRARGNTDLRYQDRYVEVFERPRGRREHWEAERIGFQGVRGNGIPPGVRHRVPVDSYDPPSNYHSGSNYTYDELRGSRSHYNAPANLQNVAIKQEEILRKYNELGEYIERIGDLTYNQGGRGDFYGGADDYVHDEFLRVRRGTVQSSGRHESPRTRHGYITGRPVHNESRYYHQEFAPRRPMDPTYDPRTENPHHPTYNLQDARHSHASVYDYKTQPNKQTHGKQTQDSTFRNPTPNNLSSNSRTSVDSKSDGSSIAYERAKKVLVSQNQQLCHPIAGGAPFVICSKCSQLLRLPGKLRAMKKSQCRLQCGSCHTTMSFNFDKKRSQSSLQTNFKPNATDELVSKSEDKNPSHNSVTGNRNRESFDFKNTGYTFPGSDSEPSTELEERRLNSREGKMRPGLSPSSSNASKEDKLSEAVSQTDSSYSQEGKPLTKLPLLRPPPGSPLRYHLDYSDMLAANKSVGDETDASAQDTTVPNKLNPDEIPKTVASEGSTDVSVRNDQGFKFQDPSPPSLNVSQAEAGVFVNGQLITRDAVRSAEKMAGTISPGVYWYDKRAGFWGLMGSHCLGIIVPFIKEFKAPMPENCSGGDTCIYVNGRELHKNDLDLLSTRGLPRTRYKYYIVDISGKVEDEDTSRFVVNLGKLAPNVERTGRGFGMQPPEMHNA